MIKLKKVNKWQPHYFLIYDRKQEVGTLEFIKKDNILIIAYLKIYPEYQHKHYGYQVIDYLFSHYKFKCIIGETLKESKGFWNKCIRKYNGMRRNIYYSDNCTSSFVIPRQEISYKKIWDLLDYSYNIIY